MRRRVLAIIMSLLVVAAFMPTMSFAGDTTRPTTPLAADKCPVCHDESIEPEIIVGSDCEGGFKKFECSCGETWVEEFGGDKASHKLVTNAMSIKEAKPLFSKRAARIEEEANETLNEFLADIIDQGTHRMKHVPDNKKVLAFVDEIGKLLLGVEYEDEALMKAKGEIEKIFNMDMDKTLDKDEIVAAFNLVIEQYLNDVERNIEAAIEENKNESYSDSFCYALVSTCKVCGDVQSIRFVKHEGTPAADCATTFVCSNENCGKTVVFRDNHYASDVTKIATTAAELAKDVVAYGEIQAANIELEKAKRNLEGGSIEKNNDSDIQLEFNGLFYNVDNTSLNAYLNAKSQLEGKNTKFGEEAKTLNSNIKLLANYMYFFDNTGKHEFKTTVEEKTCGKIVTVSCEKCHENFSFVVPTSILKHKYEWVKVHEADCKSTPWNGNGTNGLKVQKCSDCGAINLASFTPIVPKHNFVEETVEPTCSMPGYTVQRCADCGKYIPATIKNFVKPIGHDYDISMVVEPTCGNPGLLKIACKNECHETMYYAGDDLDKVIKVGKHHRKHEVTVNVVDVKNIDDLKDVKRAIEKLDKAPIVKVHDDLHDADKYFFVGFNKELLLNPIELESPDGGEHNFDTWGKIEATCLHGTQWVRKCSDCGYLDVHAAKYATEEYKDKIDGKDIKKLFVEDDDQLAHNITTTVGKKPTCGEAGYHYNYCSMCGKYYQDDQKTELVGTKKSQYRVEDPAIVDDGVKCTPADKWTTLVEPTFTENGTRVKECTVCGAYCDSDDIAKLKLGKAYQPKLSSPAKGKLKIKVKKANKYATGYQIAYKKAGGTYKFIKVNGKTPSKTITKLAKGKKYTVKVRPYRVEGKKTFYGEYSTIKTFKIK